MTEISMYAICENCGKKYKEHVLLKICPNCFEASYIKDGSYYMGVATFKLKTMPKEEYKTMTIGQTNQPQRTYTEGEVEQIKKERNEFLRLSIKWQSELAETQRELAKKLLIEAGKLRNESLELLIECSKVLYNLKMDGIAHGWEENLLDRVQNQIQYIQSIK